MAEFLRPEARAALRRWAEPALWLAVVALGLRLFLVGGWFWQGAGVLLGVVGGALFLTALRSARMRLGHDGPGVVEVDERQVTYFGPQTGGAVSIDALTRVEIETSAAGPGPTELWWLFHMPGQPPLRVPGDAAGAERLLDALAPLPGVDFDAAIRAAHSDEQALFVIWQQDRLRLH